MPIVSENFDALVPPALPAVWTFTAAAFQTVTTTPRSAPNCLNGCFVTGVTSATYNTTDGNSGNVSVSGAFRYSVGGATRVEPGLVARSNAGITTAYKAFFGLGSGSPFQGLVLLKIIGGTATQLGVAVPPTAFAQNLWYYATLKCLNTSISITVQRDSDVNYLKADGTWQAGATAAVSVTDGSITGAGFFGVQQYTLAGASILWDDLSASAVGAPTTVTLTAPAPASGFVLNESAAWAVTLDAPAGAGGAVVNLSSTGTGDVFHATPGGATVTGVTVAQNATTTTVLLVPGTTGSRNVSVTSAGLTPVNSPASYTANARTLTPAPSVLPASATTTVTFTGGGTKWTGGAPTFTPSGLAGVSVGAVTVASDTSATAPVTCGAATGSVTFTDSTTGATGAATVAVLTPVVVAANGFAATSAQLYDASGAAYGSPVTPRAAGTYQGAGNVEATFLVPYYTSYSVRWSDGLGNTLVDSVAPAPYPQTGDSFARVGPGGSALTAVPSVGTVTGAVGSVAGDVTGKVLGGGPGTITGAGAWSDVRSVGGQPVTCPGPVQVLASVGTAATGVAQSGDAYARLGAPAGASVAADVAAANAALAVSANWFLTGTVTAVTARGDFTVQFPGTAPPAAALGGLFCLFGGPGRAPQKGLIAEATPVDAASLALTFATPFPVPPAVGDAVAVG